MALDILPIAVDVLGQDRHQDRGTWREAAPVRSREPDHHRVGIGGLHCRDRFQHGLERVVRLDDTDGESDVLRRQSVTVMEDGIRHELQCDAQLVRGDLQDLAR